MLDATTQFIVDLFVLLAAAVLAGEISVHLGQAALVGQLCAGVVLGPTLLGPFFGLTGLTGALTAVQTLAVIFVLFLAGLEVVPGSIHQMEFGNFILGIAAFVIPFSIGAVLVGPVLGLGYPTNLYVALTLSITALPVMSILLDELGLSKTRLGTWLMNAALINELTAVSVFAVLLRLGSTPFENVKAIAIGVLSLALFIATILTIEQALRFLRSTPGVGADRARVHRHLAKQAGGVRPPDGPRRGGDALFAVPWSHVRCRSVLRGGSSSPARALGRRPTNRSVRSSGSMSWGFFIPLFFALIGVNMDLRDLGTLPLYRRLRPPVRVRCGRQDRHRILRGEGLRLEAIGFDRDRPSHQQPWRRRAGNGRDPARYRPHLDCDLHPDRRDRAADDDHRPDRGDPGDPEQPG